MAFLPVHWRRSVSELLWTWSWNFWFHKGWREIARTPSVLCSRFCL